MTMMTLKMMNKNIRIMAPVRGGLIQKGNENMFIYKRETKGTEVKFEFEKETDISKLAQYFTAAKNGTQQEDINNAVRNINDANINNVIIDMFAEVASDIKGFFIILEKVAKFFNAHFDGEMVINTSLTGFADEMLWRTMDHQVIVAMVFNPRLDNISITLYNHVSDKIQSQCFGTYVIYTNLKEVRNKTTMFTFINENGITPDQNKSAAADGLMRELAHHIGFNFISPKYNNTPPMMKPMSLDDLPEPSGLYLDSVQDMSTDYNNDDDDCDDE